MVTRALALFVLLLGMPGCFVAFEVADKETGAEADPTPPWPDCTPTTDPMGYCDVLQNNPMYPYNGATPGAWACDGSPSQIPTIAEQKAVGCYFALADPSYPSGGRITCCPEPPTK